jgi:hypothetical protein
MDGLVPKLSLAARRCSPRTRVSKERAALQFNGVEHSQTRFSIMTKACRYCLASGLSARNLHAIALSASNVVSSTKQADSPIRSYEEIYCDESAENAGVISRYDDSVRQR